MDKEILLQELKKISDHYFKNKDYISAGQINLAMDVIQDYDGELKNTDIRISLPLAVEFGYKQCEEGNNLEAALIEFDKVIKGEPF